MSESSHRKSAISSVLVMSCTLGSRILGFVRTATIGALFGAGGIADVINLVFNIPNNLRKLLAEGALSTAFIPELSHQIAEDSSGKSSQHLINRILGLQVLIIFPMLILSTLFPQYFIRLFENFSNPEKRELSIALFRWMMPYLFFVSVNAVMMAVQNTHDRFFIPAVTPILFSVCVLLSIFIGYLRWGAMAIGYGVFIGGIAQILLQYPSYRRLGYALVPNFSFHDSVFQRVMKKWLPMLLTSSLFAINSQIAMLLASFLPDRSVSYLTYAIVFYQLPFGIFSASITTVLFPKMSRQAALQDIQGVCDSLGFAYRNLWALLLPSAIIMIVLGEPIVAMAFQRQAFSLSDTIFTASVLAAYAVGMPFVGLFNITQRAFYAVGRVRQPFYCALAVVGIDIALSLIFVFLLDGGSQSLAWANSLSFIVGAVLQYIVLRKSIGFTLSSETGMAFGKILLITGFGLAVMLFTYRVLGRHWWQQGSNWSGFGQLLLIVGMGSFVIIGLYFWMKIEIVSVLLKK